MQKRIYILLTILPLLINNVFAEKQDDCLSALLSLDLDEAKTNIDHLLNIGDRLYYQHYYLFMLQMIDHAPYDKHKEISDLLYDLLEEIKLPDYQLSEIYLQKGIIDYTNDKYYAAIKAFNTAYNYWQESERVNPGNINNLKLKGIFNLLLAHLPLPYKNWAEWFGFKGNADEAFDALNNYYTTAKKSGKNLEAKLYLAFSMLKFSQNEIEIENFIKKESQIENPDFIKSILIRCAFKIRKPALLNNWFQSINTNSYTVLQYLKGKYLTQNFDTLAIPVFNSFIEKQKDNTFKADAYRYLSWAYLLNDKSDYYNINQKRLKALNNFPSWEDKQALYESNQEGIDNLILLKSRLLFDKGAYDKCIQILSDNKNTLAEERDYKVEYYYRLGRAYQMKFLYNTAIKYFNKAIEFHEESNRYFAPESAINRAKIEIERGDYESARNNLGVAKKINNGENKASISQNIRLLSESIENK